MFHGHACGVVQNGPQLEDLLAALESPIIHRADIAEEN